ncbi:hypothetical protein OOK27_10115 [Streptomyces canus]|uniref:MmyB family transcriptional regulator n=1 Tax=Streptomyces canus TaxID=58343 RepID=UPI00224DB665|nr:hypothetical protein [Streptomyces canus]MCX5254531.1 hypothetical protein [Streptomyces canus]
MTGDAHLNELGERRGPPGGLNSALRALRRSPCVQPELRRLLDDLIATPGVVIGRQWWGDHLVASRTKRTKRFHRPVAGELARDWDTLPVQGGSRSGTRLLTAAFRVTRPTA